ncbi:mucin-5AC-like [Anneissia japonica]|uniref:mucin-5AC-like n=1 Tax=Anneissia japonica TaxID=1529436 RepID=UPI0014259EC0|nr:mucin-5AC-like [Anneissia japonica]
MHIPTHAYDGNNCTFSMSRKGYVWKPDNHNPFMTLKTQGAIRCSSFCCNLSNCCSFNYHSDTSECEMMSASAMPSDLVVSESGTYYTSNSKIIHGSSCEGVSTPTIGSTTGPRSEATSEAVSTPTVGSTAGPSSAATTKCSNNQGSVNTHSRFGPSSAATTKVVSTPTVGSTGGPSSEATSDIVSTPTVGSTTEPSSEPTSEAVSTPTVSSTAGPSSAATTKVVSTPTVGSTAGPSSEATSEVVSTIVASSSEATTESVETDCFTSPYSNTVDIPPYSGCYVGVSTAAVPASSFSASSGQNLAHFARLGCQQSADIGGWIGNARGWLQVDLITLTTVYGVITQGGVCDSVNDCPNITHDGSSGDVYYTSYIKVGWNVDIDSHGWSAFLNPSDNSEVFPANTDCGTPLLNWFSTHEITRYLRMYIKSFVNSPALRFELLNCPKKN